MPSHIHIAEPCHENWDTMQPAEQGRHCLACCKTVVDFTGWNTPDITAYLADPANKKTCGRFYETQLNVPVISEPEEWMHRISSSRLSAVKKVAAIIVVVFGLLQSGCQPPVTTMGMMVRPEVAREMQQAHDTIPRKPIKPIQPHILLGDTVMINDSTPVCKPDSTKEPGTVRGKVILKTPKHPK